MALRRLFGAFVLIALLASLMLSDPFHAAPPKPSNPCPYAGGCF